MSERRIRPLTAADLPACGALVDASSLLQRYAYSGERAMAQLEATLSDAAQLVLVAEGEFGGQPDRGRSDHVLGFAWLILRGGFGRSAYLRLILVDPAAKGAGIGAALLRELEARHLSPGGLLLLCTTDNVVARAFYERAGYQRVGELPGYVGPGLDETIYFKPAPSARKADRPGDEG